MSKSIHMQMRMFGACAGLATFVAGGTAFAEEDYFHGTSVHDGDEFGNGNFYARYAYSTTEESEKRSSATSHSRRSFALASFWVKAKVFGKEQTPIFFQGGGLAHMSKVQTNPSQHSDTVFAVAELLGDELLNIRSDTPCEGRGPEWSCASFQKSIAKTLFRASESFTVGIVPVTVKARVTGELGGGLNGAARCTNYLGRDDSIYGHGYGSLNAGAYVNASLDAVAGVEDVLAVGVTASLRLIDLELTPTVMSKSVAPFNASVKAHIVHTNEMPLSLKTLGGKIDVWADITPLVTVRKTLINWSGYTWTTPLSGFTDEIVDL